MSQPAAPKGGATIDDLYRVPENGKAEIVNGELVLMTAAGGVHGYAGGLICPSLLDYARRTKRGVALPDNVGFIINLPDTHTAYGRGQRAEAERALPGWSIEVDDLFPPSWLSEGGQ